MNPFMEEALGEAQAAAAGGEDAALELRREAGREAQECVVVRRPRLTVEA